MLAQFCSRAQMPFPDHTLDFCCKDLSELRMLYLKWASPEPVIFGDALMGLAQLETLELELSDFRRLQQLPPHVKSLGLGTWKLLDMAMVPCLQSCSSLQSLEFDSDAGVRRDAVALSTEAISLRLSITRDCMTCRACKFPAGRLAGAHQINCCQL